MTRFAAPRAVGIIVTILALMAVVLTFHPPQAPWDRPLQISLEASTFGRLDDNAGVEIGGVKVGQVNGLGYSAGHPVVHLKIDSQYTKLVHADTGATIRPHGLLGPKYVELDGGKSGQIGKGTVIPSSRVHVTVDVDDVLNSLQPDVRANLQTVFDELGTASDGRGADMNAVFQSLGTSATDLATTTAVLRARDQDLADFFVYSEILNRDVQYAPVDANIRDTRAVLDGLVQVETSIGGTIDHTANFTRELDTVFNGNSDNLAATLQKLPQTVTKLQVVVAAGDTLVSGLNPALPSLMVVVVETESAFSYKDADGHYVKVEAFTNACTGGAPAGCGSPGGGPRSDPKNGAPASGPSGGGAQPSPQITDQGIINAMMGR